MDFRKIGLGLHRAFAGIVIEHHRPNQHPVQTARSDHILLTVLVVVHLAQKQRQDELIEHEAAMSPAIARAEASDADQPANLLLGHHVHDAARCG